MSEDNPHPLIYEYIEPPVEHSKTPNYCPVVWLSEEEIKKLYPKKLYPKK